MALMDRIDEIVDYIKDNEMYLDHNRILFEIKEGRLEPYVQEDLKKTLSSNYYNQIKSRVIPINVLRRIIDKLSKSYADEPTREVVEENETDSDLLEYYQDKFNMNLNGNHADEFANLFKGYAWEPYLSSAGEPKLRTLPFDRFLVMSDDMTDPTQETVFLKSMGKRRLNDGSSDALWFAYSKDEFLPFTMGGTVYEPALVSNGGENPIGEIPFMYGNRSPFELLPMQDTDLLPMTKVIPILMTDLSGTILFQCFSVIWGIDVDSENLTMSPNAFWSLKSDPKTDKQPQVGQLKPQADIDKVVEFIKNTFSFWLESRNIRVGSMGSLNGDNMSSGISKVIDEMDTTEMRKLSMQHFQREEQQFWQLIKVMHNRWVDQGMLAEAKPRFSDAFDVSITFHEPEPKIDRLTTVNTVALEVERGFLDMRTALKRLYPDLKDDQIEDRLKLIKEDKSIVVDAEPIEDEPDDDESESHFHLGTGESMIVGSDESGMHYHLMEDGSGQTTVDAEGASHSHQAPDGSSVGEPIGE